MGDMPFQMRHVACYVFDQSWMLSRGVRPFFRLAFSRSAPPRRTSSTPTPAVLARSPGGRRPRTPRNGIHEKTGRTSPFPLSASIAFAHYPNCNWRPICPMPLLCTSKLLARPFVLLQVPLVIDCSRLSRPLSDLQGCWRSV